MRKVVYISDFSLGEIHNGTAVARSGYSGIGMELCEHLYQAGYDVKALGLGYTGQEHGAHFSLIPCNDMKDVMGTLNNLKYLWNPDVVICAMDIHYFQETIFPVAKKLDLKYICITPLESEPLCMTWANLLMQMDKVFFISEFGSQEAIKTGVEAEHIQIGIDTKSWRLRTKEEYDKVRQTFGFDKSDFVVLTVADNQERKNLSRGFEIIAELKKRGIPVKHILVTREESMVGWKLYDLAMELGISSDLRIFKSGMPFIDIFALYAGADAFLLCSKGEGLGLPVVESMAVGVPVVANGTGAIRELLANNRGSVIEPDYMEIDPFGNQKRYFVNLQAAADALQSIYENGFDTSSSREYVESRTWDIPAKQLQNAIEGLFDGQDTPV